MKELFAVAAVLLAAATPARAQSTWFVDDDAPAGGDGTSWGSAFQFLQDALAVAQPGDDVRVAGGSYRPDQGGGETPLDYDATFTLDSLTIAGGYRGLAAGGSADDRDFVLFPSILNGDLKQDDPSLADNSSLLVDLAGDAVLDGLVLEATTGRPGVVCGAVTIWDHLLTARDCEFREHERTACSSLAYGSLTAERCWFHHNHSAAIGGVYVITLEDSLFEDHDDGVIHLFNGDTLTGKRCVFRRNVDDDEGAAINSYDSDATLEDCVFEDNTSTANDYFGGGAIMCFDECSLRLHRTRFTRNTSASSGGAVNVWSQDYPVTVEIEGCLFEDNHADWGGALSLFVFDPVSLVDCRFVGNSAVNGSGAGGAYLHSIERCAFVGNTAGGGTGGFYASTSGWDLAIVDSTFEGNTGTTVSALTVSGHAGDTTRFDRCTVAGNHATSATSTAVSSVAKGAQSLRIADAILFDNDRAGVEDEAAQLSAAAGVIQIDRSCVEGWTGALGGSGNFGSDPLFVDPATGRYDLQLASPCVEAGDAAYVPAAGFERDVAGNGRVLDAQLDRSPRLDLGAYEFAHARLGVTGSATPGGSLTLTLDGTPGLPALLFLGFGESALRVGRLGYLFVDLGTPFLLLPWSAAPSQVTASLPSDTPVPLTFFLQAAVFQSPSGNFSNVVRVDVR